MDILRRTLLSLAVAAGIATPAIAAEDWTPSKPIKLVLGYTPGGAADAVARDVARVMEKTLGQPIVIDYRAGAAGVIGAEAVATAPPDGYTIGLIDGAPLSIVPVIRKVPYDPNASFSYLGVVAKAPLVILVNPNLPVHSVPELIEFARKKPGALSFSTSGAGSIHQLAAELLKVKTGTFMVHVPYRGASQAMTDLMAGQVELSFATIAPALGVIKGGKARAIGVTSTREVVSLPGVKPVAEQGVPGYDAQGWFVLAGPKGLPDAVARRLTAALNDAVSQPDVRDKLSRLGVDVATSTAAEAAALVKQDGSKWVQIVRDQNLKFD